MKEPVVKTGSDLAARPSPSLLLLRVKADADCVYARSHEDR